MAEVTPDVEETRAIIIDSLGGLHRLMQAIGMPTEQDAGDLIVALERLILWAKRLKEAAHG